MYSSSIDIEKQQVDGTMTSADDSANSVEINKDMTAKSAHSSKTRTSTKSSKTRISLPVDQSVVKMVESYTEKPIAEDDDPNKRKTQLYCGFCCDILMACWIVDVMYVPWMVQSILFNLDLWQNSPGLLLNNDDAINDDVLPDDDDDQINPLVLLAIKNGVGILFGLIGILGAVKMYKWLGLSTGIWFCVDLVWSCVFGRYVMLILVFNIYPHFALFEALWKGKITPENYKRRERSCCCTYCNDNESSKA